MFKKKWKEEGGKVDKKGGRDADKFTEGKRGLWR